MRLLILLLLFPFTVNATDWYVSSSTGGSNAGTIANPWQSLGDIVMGSLNPGDNVLFKRGDTFTGQIVISRSGSAGNPISFGAYGSGAKPLFTGSGTTPIMYLFYMIGRDYLIFDNLEVYDPTLVGGATSDQAHIQRAWWFDVGCENNTVQNCKVSYAGDAVVLIGGNNTVQYNDFGNLRLILNNPTPGNDYGANPLDIQSANNVIVHNYLHHTICISFDFGFDGGAIEFYNPSGGIDNNLVAYNRIELNTGTVEITGDGAGNIFAFNEIINNGSVIYFHSGATYTGWVYTNNIIIENVTSATSDPYLFEQQAGSFASGQLSLINNIFYLTTGIDVADDATNMVHTNNCYYNFSGGSIPNYTLHGSEFSTSSAIWASTSGSVYDWDFHPLDATTLDDGIDPLSYITPYTDDYFGTSIEAPYYIGVGQYIGTPTPPANQIRFPARINGVLYSGWQ